MRSTQCAVCADRGRGIYAAHSRLPRKPVARHHQLARVLVLARRVARLSADHKLGLGEGLREIEGRLEGADNIVPPVVRVRVRGVGSGSGV